MSEVVTRKKKTSDRDIKDFFADYSRARGRRRVLMSKTISRPMTEEEQTEYNELGLFLLCVEGIVDSLEPLVSKIVREYYIDHDTLFNISMDINYCYEHVSYLKNIGCDNIRKMLAGEEVIQNDQSIKLIELIDKIIKEKTHEQAKEK